MTLGLRSIATIVAVTLIGGCVGSSDIAPTGGQPGAMSFTAVTTTTVARPVVLPVATLGQFPEAPEGPVTEAMNSSLQSVLDEAVSNGAIGRGVVAAVIRVGSGSWAGASGVDIGGDPLAPESQVMVASIGKTVTAAQVMRLVDEGTLRLLDPITDHLPPEVVSAFDANGATIQDLLGMRSGFLEPPGYEGLVDSGMRPIGLLERLPHPHDTPGSRISYVNMNYVLLGMIIEHETGIALADALEAGVLSSPDLAGIEYGVTDALAGDGWMIVSDALTLARWGYELYGGFVVSEESLRAMTDFDGDWYGLGTIDFTARADAGYDIPSVGHGGLGPPLATALVVFPERGLVIGVLAPAASLDQVFMIVATLRDVVDT